ncbi:MAG: DUF86 domain-containing protein [Neisseriaceae bacterium]|nr:DUF86 domain-containing protein [Neisseriaceae bacterium]
MSFNRCEDYLNHIAQALHLALSYIDGLHLADFLDDTCTQQACIMNVLIIVEAASKLINDYPDFVAQHPEIEWYSMRGMRNRIAHGYFDIDLEVVWETLQTALPDLQQKIQAIQNG